MAAAARPYLVCPPLGPGAYGRWFTDVAVWRPYVSTVATAHGLPAPERVWVGVPGSHPVFRTDQGYVVKFFAPHWPGQAEAERAVCEALRAGAPGVAVPAVLGAGELFPGAGGRWSWPYLALSTLPGRSVGEARGQIDAPAMRSVARTLGSIIRSIRAVPAPDRLARASAARLAVRRGTAMDRRRREGGWPESLLGEVPRYVEEAWEKSLTIGPRLAHGDLTADHVLVVRRGLGWEISGLIDFADAEVVDPAYELVALQVDLFRCVHGLMAAFLEAYGGETALGSGWRMRATAFVLTHPFNLAPALASVVPGWADVRTPEELAALLWPAG